MKNPFPKIVPLPGSVHVEFKRCGRSNCRCRNEHPHGPYFVRRWREDGRQRKAYVPRELVPTVLLAIESRRSMLPPVSTLLCQLASRKEIR